MFIEKIIFRDNIEFEISKKSHERFNTITHQPTQYTREKKPWTMFKLFEKDLNIKCEPLTLIVGDNGMGKSTLLKEINKWGGSIDEQGWSTVEEQAEQILKHRQKISPINLKLNKKLLPNQTIFFDIETNNLRDNVQNDFTPTNNSLDLFVLLLDTQTNSHGENVIPVLEYILSLEDRLILMDEPDVSLSIKNQKKFWNMILESSKKNQIIISTHNSLWISEAEYVYDLDTKQSYSGVKYLKTL